MFGFGDRDWYILGHGDKLYISRYKFILHLTKHDWKRRKQNISIHIINTGILMNIVTKTAIQYNQ